MTHNLAITIAAVDAIESAAYRVAVEGKGALDSVKKPTNPYLGAVA